MPVSRRQLVKAFAAGSLLLGYSRTGSPQTSQVVTVAGTGERGSSIEEPGAIATATAINNPYGIVPGPDGALYFCEVDSGRTRRIDLQRNQLMTIAGNGEKGFRHESRSPLQTPFSAPHEIRWDEAGNLYIVERDGHCIRRISRMAGLVTTMAGNGEPGFNGDGRAGVLSQLNRPHSIAFDSRGNLLICDLGNQRLRRISRETGIISTIGGTGEAASTPDEAPLSGTPLHGPRSLATDSDGNAYLCLREGNAIFSIDLGSNRLRRIAGTGEQGYSGDGGPALQARFNGPKGIAYSRDDNSLYIVDTENHVIRKMSLLTGIIETVLGTGEQGNGVDGDPLSCSLNRPHGVCIYSGVVFITDSENHRVRAILSA